MQEPGSPLVPLDPTRLQQQMQQPMRETVARTISTSSVGSLESGVGGHYMEMQAPSTPQFQQQMSPQFSPLPTSQQRFWNPQPSPRPPYQQQQGYGQMVRMPQVSQQQSSQSSQSPRITLMGPLAQAISPDMVKLSSPNAGQSPMGSPVQPQPPQNLTPNSVHQQQQQQPMIYQQQQAAAMYQQQQQQQQQMMQGGPYQQQMNNPSANMVGQHQFQPQMMQYQQQQQQPPQVNQSFPNQSSMNRQPMAMPQQQMRMMAPPQAQSMSGQRIILSQAPQRFLQGNQPVQQGMYANPPSNMMYVVQQQQQQQQQRMGPGSNVGSQLAPQYQTQHPGQNQFSGGYPPQQYMPVSGPGPGNYVQGPQPPQCMPPQQQAVMQQQQQAMQSARYGVQQGHPGQIMPQQNLHFQPRQALPTTQQYHQYSMQVPQPYNTTGSSSAAHVQQQQTMPQSSTNSVQSLQQIPPSPSVPPQHQQQQIMYQGSSPINGPRPPNVGAQPQQQQQQNAMIRHAAFLNSNGPTPSQQHLVAVGHGGIPSTAQGSLQSGPSEAMRPPQYFGHDPNVNIHPDMCLLGCVFLIVDYDRILDQKEVSDWRTVIVQHGGEVETSYSNKCSHVICESLRHPVVQQALKESKRCVTAQWLNDCVLLKRMQPPWRSVHFPSPFGDNKPCKNRIFSVCGFDANERSCLKQMIMAVGARYTTYLSRHNTLLIAKCTDGQQKVAKAREWKIPIVNVHWLTELFLGQQAVVQNMNNPKYLQFMPKELVQQGNVDLFRIEPSISPVLVLMTAWRSPIAVNGDCWKLASERKQKLEDDCKLFPYKKIKLSPAPEDDEIENNRKEIQNSVPPDCLPKICFTGLYQAEVENLTKKALWLNAVIVQDVKECTHLVASDLKRTKKLLESIALGRFIVSPLWIRQSYKQLQFADSVDYIVKDEGNEKFFGFNIKLSIYRARMKRLFEDMIFYLTPSIQPYPSTLIELIQTSGGSVLQQRPPSSRIAELQQNGVQIVIITCENDLHLCQHLLELAIAVHSAEFVLTGILRQEVDFTSYRIEPKQNEGSKPSRETS